LADDTVDNAMGVDEQAHVAAPAAARGRRWALLTAQAALSVVLAYLALRNVDWTSLGDMARRQSVVFFAGSCLIYALTTPVYAWRWQEILRAMGCRIRLGLLVRQCLVGFFFNNFAPSMLGQDAAKTYYLGRDTGYVTAGVSVLVDKIIGLGGLTLVSAALIPLLGLKGVLFATAFSASVLFALACAGVLLMARLPVERLLPGFLTRGRLGNKLLELAGRIRMQTSGAVDLRALAAGVATIVIAMTMQAVIYAWFIREALGTSPGIPQLVCALCLVSTLANMPVSINGIGVREQAHAVILAGFGVPLEAAVGLSLLQYVYMTVLSVLGWGLWLTRKPKTLLAK
jgi:uncharacterized membrane protein YbhN (UPF0104 family)